MVKKATKLQATYEAGDRAALAEALALMEPAVAHKKVAVDPAAWARLGHLRWERARAASDLEDAQAAARELSKAIELGAAGELLDAVQSDQKAILALLFQRAVDDLESGRPAEASAVLAPAAALRAELADGGVVLDALEQRFNVVAAQIELGSGRVDEALVFHDAHVDTGNVNAGLTAAIAKALAEAERAPDALALLARVRALQPDNPRLLRAEVMMLSQTGDAAGAVGRVDAAKEWLWGSVSGAYLMFELYREVGALDPALAAAARVLEQDPQHADTLRGIGAVRSSRADAAQAKLDAGGLKSADKRTLKAAVTVDRKEAIASYEAARRVDGLHIPTLRALAAAYRAVGNTKAAQPIDDEATKLESPQ